MRTVRHPVPFRVPAARARLPDAFEHDSRRGWSWTKYRTQPGANQARKGGAAASATRWTAPTAAAASPAREAAAALPAIATAVNDHRGSVTPEQIDALRAAGAMDEETRAVRPPLPPFDEQSALIRVRATEGAWNTRDPDRVAAAYTEDCVWRTVRSS